MFRVVLLSLISSATFLVAAPQPQPFRRPLVFEPNRGQASPQVKWLARGPGYQLFLTNEGVTMTIQEGPAPPLKGDMVRSSAQPYGPRFAHAATGYSIVNMKLIGSRPWSNATGLEPTGGVSNYLRSADGKRSLTNLPHYARVSVPGVYKGVDLVFYSHDGNLEYDFVVAPGADPKQIQWAFEGTKKVRVDEKSGDLVLTTAGGSEMRQVRPNVYQQMGKQRAKVGGDYELLGGQHVAFSIAPYDRRHELVIDPTVSFSTDFGYATSETVYAVAVDSAGNSYVTGQTNRKDFPVTNGSKWLDADCNSFFPPHFCAIGYNTFVAKLSPTGMVLFATYVGVGSGNAIAVDSTGVYVTGGEYKPDIDNIIGYAGGLDIFVLKLSLDGQVIYKNIFGTEKDEAGNAIAVDSQHNAWIAGWTKSHGPVTDMQIIKVGPTGLYIREQAYAAAGNSIAYGIAVDPAGQPWITGQTCGGGFPVTNSTTVGPDSSPLCKVFVLQLEGPGTTPYIVTRMSMVFGGSTAGDAGYAILPNGSNAAYVTGVTNAPNFPTTLGAYQTAKLSAGPSGFVTEVDDASFTGKIVHSTLLGGSIDTVGQAMASIDAGAVYIGGYTPDSGFIQKLKFDLTKSAYTKTLFSRVNGLAVLKPSAASGVPEIYAGGDDAQHYSEVAKLDDDVVQSQVLWHNTATGQLTAWTLDAQGRVTSTQPLSAQCAASTGCSQSWKVIGTLDSNRDGVDDVLFYNATTGELQTWLLNSTGAVTGTQSLSRQCGTSDGCSQSWKPVGVGDFNGDGNQDVLWHNDVTGQLQAWLLNGGQITSTLTFAQVCRVSEGCWPRWQIIAIGDFNSDGIDDLFWYDTQTGKVDVGMQDGRGKQKAAQWLAKVCGPSDGCSQNWKPAGIADVNQDGTGDLLWENVTSGEISAWLLNGTDRIQGTSSLSLRCDSTVGCPPGSLPVGILRNRLATP